MCGRSSRSAVRRRTALDRGGGPPARELPDGPVETDGRMSRALEIAVVEVGDHRRGENRDDASELSEPALREDLLGDAREHLGAGAPGEVHGIRAVRVPEHLEDLVAGA